MIRIANNEEINLLNKEVAYKISENVFEKCFIYKLDDKIIGFIDFSDLYDRLELNYIWVKPEYRGLKHAHILMDYMFNYAKEKDNISNVTLEVSVNNDIAINLYEKYEFKKTAIRKQYYNGVDGILMMRKFD